MKLVSTLHASTSPDTTLVGSACMQERCRLVTLPILSGAKDLHRLCTAVIAYGCHTADHISITYSRVPILAKRGAGHCRQRSTTQHSKAQHSTVQHSTAQHMSDSRQDASVWQAAPRLQGQGVPLGMAKMQLNCRAGDGTSVLTQPGKASALGGCRFARAARSLSLCAGVRLE